MIWGKGQARSILPNFINFTSYDYFVDVNFLSWLDAKEKTIRVLVSFRIGSDGLLIVSYVCASF